MIIALGTTSQTPDPPPVEIAADEALLVNAGAYRVVIKGDGTMHVIDDREGDTVFEWPVPTRYVVVGHLTPTDGDPDPAVQGKLDAGVQVVVCQTREQVEHELVWYLDGIVREIET